jgi:hypothetical protein
VCQLGLQFFPDPVRGLAEFRRVLHVGRWTAVCVISTPDRAPMWDVLAEALSRHLPAQHDTLHLTLRWQIPSGSPTCLGWPAFTTSGCSARRAKGPWRRSTTTGL